MKKANPLFVDTTKFNGDSLFTQVELNGIPPYVGEVVSIKVFDKAGVEHIVELERQSETQCTGQVFLTYRQEISYIFLVSRNGEPLFLTEPKACIASYLIQDVWKPISLHPELEMVTEQAPPEPQTEVPSDIADDLEVIADQGEIPEEVPIEALPEAPTEIQTEPDIPIYAQDALEDGDLESLNETF